MIGHCTQYAPNGVSRILDVTAVSVFILGLVGWFLALPLIALVMQEWMAYPVAGDAAIGLIIFGPLVLFVSFIFLVTSIVLGFWAKRLPRWFRIVTIASPAIGCLVGMAIIYRALGG